MRSLLQLSLPRSLRALLTAALVWVGLELSDVPEVLEWLTHTSLSTEQVATDDPCCPEPSTQPTVHAEQHTEAQNGCKKSGCHGDKHHCGCCLPAPANIPDTHIKIPWLAFHESPHDWPPQKPPSTSNTPPRPPPRV